MEKTDLIKIIRQREIAELQSDRSSYIHSIKLLEDELSRLYDRLKECDEKIKEIDNYHISNYRKTYELQSIVGKSQEKSNVYSSLQNTIINTLSELGVALPKSNLERLLRKKGIVIETKDVLRRMKDRGQIVSVVYNNSPRYSFLALPNWVDYENKRLYSEFASNEKLIGFEITDIKITFNTI